MSHTTNCGCTETQETTYICNECQPSTPCDCPVKDLSTDCILFTEDTIQCQNTDVVPQNTILSIALKNIVDFFCQKMVELQNYLRLINIGTGAKIYKGDTLLGVKQLRTIKTENLGTGATILKSEVEDTDEILLVTKSLLVESQGGGASAIKDLQQNTDDITLRLKTFTSSDSTITITESGDEIDFQIAAPPGLGAIRTFYVNSNYIPTIDSPADGSIIRPYTEYDDARIAFIGTGTITAPQYPGAMIILQTNSYTAINPTVNNLDLEIEAGVTLTYTGADDYMFDTEVLYPLIAKGVPRDNLLESISIRVSGKGIITRTEGIGLVRGWGSNRNGLGLAGDNDSIVVIAGDLTLTERSIYPNATWDGDITDTLGTPLETIYGVPYKYSLSLAPTMPLVDAKYESVLPFRWGVITEGNITFRTLVNTAIRVEGIPFTGNNLSFYVLGNYIATTSGTKMVSFPDTYQPLPNRHMIELDNANIALSAGGKIIVDDAQGFATTGVKNFIKVINNGNLQNGNMNIACNYLIETLLNVSDVTNTDNYFDLSTTLDGSRVKAPGIYFIDTPLTPYTIKMLNSNVSGFTNKSTLPITLIINTEGTFSSFLDTPVISNIDSYADDATALAAGLVADSLYFNTTTNALDLV